MRDGVYATAIYTVAQSVANPPTKTLSEWGLKAAIGADHSIVYSGIKL